MKWNLALVVSSLASLTVASAVEVDFDALGWPSCFAAGTAVTMADGSSKAIEDVNAGDVVKTSYGSAKVEKVIESAPGVDIKTVSFANGAKFVATASHPIFTKLGFVAAGDIQVGTTVFSKAGETTVASVVFSEYSGNLYNLFISNNPAKDNFYAEGILVGGIDTQLKK